MFMYDRVRYGVSFRYHREQLGCKSDHWTPYRQVFPLGQGRKRHGVRNNPLRQSFSGLCPLHWKRNGEGVQYSMLSRLFMPQSLIITVSSKVCRMNAISFTLPSMVALSWKSFPSPGRYIRVEVGLVISIYLYACPTVK